MAEAKEGSSLGGLKLCVSESPNEILDAIKRFFNDRRVFGEILSLEHQGIWYRVWCDEQCFMVYRANDSGGSFHHVPGWPVCLVTSHTVFEECNAPYLADDHHSCELDITRWLEVVASYLARRERDSSL